MFEKFTGSPWHFEARLGSVNTLTTDLRGIYYGGFSLREGDIPLMLKLSPEPWKHEGSRTIGKFTNIWGEGVDILGLGYIVRDLCPIRLDNTIKYGCGMDMDQIRTEVVPHPDSEDGWDGAHWLTRGRLMGVTMYAPESNTQPAFPNAYIAHDGRYTNE